MNPRLLLLLPLLLAAVGCEETVERTTRYTVIERYYDGTLYRQFYRKGFEQYGRLRTYRFRPGTNGGKGFWVPIGNHDLADQIEARGMAVDASTTSHSDSSPLRAAAAAVRRRVYLLDIYGTDRVVSIDGETGAVLGKVDLGQQSPAGIVLSPDGRRLYVIHGTQKAFNNIPYKPPALVVLTTDPLAVERRFELPSTLVPNLGDQPMAVSADGGSLYVMTATPADGIVRLDPATGAIRNRIPYPAASGMFRTLALSPDGDVLYALGDGRIYAIDTLTQTISMERTVVHTNSMAVHPNGGTVYIGLLTPPAIAIFDTVAGAITGTIPLAESRGRRGLTVSGDGLDLFVNDDLGGKLWRIWLPDRSVDTPFDEPTAGGVIAAGP